MYLQDARCDNKDDCFLFIRFPYATVTAPVLHFTYSRSHQIPKLTASLHDTLKSLGKLHS